MSETASELRFHAKMPSIPEGTAAIMNNAADQLDRASDEIERLQKLAWKYLQEVGNQTRARS